MKILHTSDWHIGHIFNGIERYDEYEKFFNFLRDLIIEKKIDILLISGDIFDVYFPSTKAITQYYDFLVSLKGLVEKVIIIGGNHDSPKLLKAPKEVLKFINVEIVSGDSDNYKRIFEFDDFIILAVSYLREGILNKIDNDLLRAVEKVYEIESNKKIIATGHLTVYGASESGSEREIYIGKIEALPSSIFKKFDYAALGHIHKFQKVDKNIYYSGSPLQMGYDENYEKKVIILDTDDFSLEFVNVPKFRDFVRLNGSLEDVKKEIEKIKPYSFVEIELDSNYSSEDLEELKRDDVYITKIKLPYTSTQELNLDIKKSSFKEIIEKIFEDDEDIEEIKKILFRIREEVKEV
jgi:exonuclease SbcD